MEKMVCSLVMAVALLVPSAAHAQRAHLPLHVETNDRIGGGNWVEVRASLNDGATPRIEGLIKVKNFVFLSGFVGVGILNVHDARGNVIGRFDLPSIGVNGEIFGGAIRSKPFSIDIPPAMADQARSLTVEAFYGGNPRLEDLIKEGRRLYDLLDKK